MQKAAFAFRYLARDSKNKEQHNAGIINIQSEKISIKILFNKYSQAVSCTNKHSQAISVQKFSVTTPFYVRMEKCKP